MYFKDVIDIGVSKIPRVDNIEITNLCNMNCPVCIERCCNEGKIDLELLEKILSKNQYVLEGKPVWLHLRGEPFTNKDIFKIIQMFYDFNVPTRLSTNGILMAKNNNVEKTLDSKLYMIVFSVMTLDRQKYIELRGKDCLDIVLNNIKEFKEMALKKNSNINIQVMGLDYGQDRKEVSNFIRYFNNMGLDVGMHKYTDRTTNSMYNPNPSFKNEYMLTRREPCKWIFDSVVITYDGLVNTCCFDLSCENVLCALKDYDYSIEKIWNGVEFRKMRENHLNGVFEKSCAKCSDWIYNKQSTPKDHRSLVTIYPFNGTPYNV